MADAIVTPSVKYPIPSPWLQLEKLAGTIVEAAVEASP